jgi:tellurite methyltransferase
MAEGGSVLTLQEQVDGIDIYLLDQVLRGRIAPGMTILDAGCGSGRNLVYFLRTGHQVFAVDRVPELVAHVQQLAAALAPALPASNFRPEAVEAMSFEDECADVVISSAVLHLAHTDAQFEAMLLGSWRVLKPGGVLFARLASTIGMEQRCRSIDGRWCELPDGTQRYLVDEAFLLRATDRLGGELLDPLKTTVVQNLRCMTTWVVRKGPGPASARRAGPRGRRALGAGVDCADKLEIGPRELQSDDD